MNELHNKKLLIFLFINFSFMIIQLIYSSKTKSLCLLTDSLHMFLDCFSLGVGLAAEYLVQTKQENVFDLWNIKDLSAFFNGIFLINLSIETLIEGVKRLWKTVILKEINRLIIVSTLGLFVNIYGMIVVHSTNICSTKDSTKEHGENEVYHNCNSHNDLTKNKNMHGVFLHILADTLGSVSVIISSLTYSFSSWNFIDPLMSLIVSFIIFFSAIPLIKSTFKLLVLSTDVELQNKIIEVIDELKKLDNIVELKKLKIWNDHSGKSVGYIDVKIDSEKKVTQLKSNCENLFKKKKLKILLQISK